MLKEVSSFWYFCISLNSHWKDDQPLNKVIYSWDDVKKNKIGFSDS